MSVTRVLSVFGGATVFLLAGTCFAQNSNKFAFSAGGGFTEPVVHSDGRFDPGFNLGAGAGYNFNSRLGLMGEFGFNHLGIASAALNAAGVPAGSGRIYSLTLDPVVHFNPHGKFDVYAIGGGGYYRRTVELTQPTVETVTAFNPFFGYYPANIATNVVLGSFTQNKAGLNIGGGVSMRLRGDSNMKFYAEARYHYLFTGPVRTTVLPVTFGLRW
jgi:outer membrane protein with beta-barrel domain